MVTTLSSRDSMQPAKPYEIEAELLVEVEMVSHSVFVPIEVNLALFGVLCGLQSMLIKRRPRTGDFTASLINMKQK